MGKYIHKGSLTYREIATLIAQNIAKIMYIIGLSYRARYKNIQNTASVAQIVAVRHYEYYLFSLPFLSLPLYSSRYEKLVLIFTEIDEEHTSIVVSSH